MIKRLLVLFFFVVLIGALLSAGHSLLFSRFMLYDDEGYVLISLRNFAQHGSLYDQVFTQYGPAFYLGYDALQHLLGFAWTNTTGRWITLFNWGGTAGFCALLMWRACAAWPLVLFVLANVFSYLWIMIQEPMHPGSTIALLVAGAAWAGWEALRAGRMTLFAIITGIAGATLALIKINVGAFFVATTVFWLLLSMRPATDSPRLRFALAGMGLLLPIVLMRSLLDEPWVMTFAIVGGLAVANAILATGPAAKLYPAKLCTWAWFILTGLITTAVFSGLLLGRGTTVQGLWEGVVLAPLKHPGIYSFPVRWRPAVIPAALASVGLLLVALRHPDDRRVILTVAWLRIIVVVLFQLTLLPWLATSEAAIGLCYGLALAGLFAWPLHRSSEPKITSAHLARSWLALLFVFQALHAYPVAGSQLNWGTFLWLPLMVLGLEEAIAIVLAGRSTRLARWTRLAIYAVLFSLAASMTSTLVKIARSDHQNSVPLQLPGAEDIGLPAAITSALRIITENARFHGDLLFSLPGAYSLNLWSGVATPTLANATHWFSLLDADKQQAIIARMEASPRSLIVVQHVILTNLRKTGFHPDGPLIQYLYSHYRRAFVISDYSLWIRNERSIAPLSTGTLLRSSQSGSIDFRLELTLDARPGEAVRINLLSLADNPRLLLELNPTNTQAEVTPLRPDGSSDGPTVPLPWPLCIKTLSRLSLSFKAPAPFPPPEPIQAVLMANDGHPVASARVLDANSGELPPAANSP